MCLLYFYHLAGALAKRAKMNFNAHSNCPFEEIAYICLPNMYYKHERLAMSKHFFYLLLSVLLIGCQVDYHPYDTRIDGEQGINAKNIARIEAATAGKRIVRVAMISDSQRWYDETRDVVRALNSRDDIDFVIHTGDVADFGMKVEFERQRDILSNLHVPYVVLIGNHDCLATGETIFKRIFGEPNFAFTAGCLRFICLNTNALEFDHSVPVPDFSYMKRQYEQFPAEATKTVVAMHAKPFTEQFDNNVAQTFQYYVRQYPNLQCCLNGHGHNFAIDDVFNDGVLYYECDNVGKRTYLLFTFDEEGYTYERIAF